MDQKEQNVQSKTELLYELLNINKWFVRMAVYEGIRVANYKKKQSVLSKNVEADIEAAIAYLAYREGLLYDELKEINEVENMDRVIILDMLDQLASKSINFYITNNILKRERE